MEPVTSKIEAMVNLAIIGLNLVLLYIGMVQITTLFFLFRVASRIVLLHEVQNHTKSNFVLNCCDCSIAYGKTKCQMFYIVMPTYLG